MTILAVPLILWPLLGPVIGGILYWIKRSLEKKRFTVLGREATGKSKLHDFLSTGEISTSYEQTTTRPTKGGVIKLGDLKLRIKRSVDISGSADYGGQWESLIKEADYVCYMVDTEKIHNGDADYTDIVSADLDIILKALKTKKNILKALKTKKNPGKLYVMFSFCDKIEDYNTRQESFTDSFKKKHNKLNKPGTIFLFGSLDKKENAEKFVAKMISHILNTK